MGLRIATNIQSLAAQRYLSKNTADQNRSFERLSSGSRINRAGDDAAGMAISERLRANLRSMQQAKRNAQDGVSMIQTTEGAMNEISSILIRLRELSIQTASDTVSDVERGFVDKEVQQLKSEIQRIAKSTKYNGLKILDGTANEDGEGMLDFQVGINNDAFEDRISFDVKKQNMTLEALGLLEVNTGTKTNAQANLSMLDDAIVGVNSSRSTLGALQNRMQSTINNLEVYYENLATANSRIRDTDVATETTELTKANILQQSNISVLAQANQAKAVALKLL